jgi:hypothetical protein
MYKPTSGIWATYFRKVHALDAFASQGRTNRRLGTCLARRDNQLHDLIVLDGFARHVRRDEVEQDDRAKKIHFEETESSKLAGIGERDGPKLTLGVGYRRYDGYKRATKIGNTSTIQDL